MSKLNPQKASAYVGPGVLRKGGKITPVPNGPLVKKKGVYAGSTLKAGGKIKKAQDGIKKDSILAKQRKINLDALNKISDDFAKKQLEKRRLELYRNKPKSSFKAGGAIKKAMLGSSMFKDNPIYKKTTDLRGKIGSAALGMPGMKPIAKNGKDMIKRADGSYSQRGLWDNIRANKGSGKKPTKQMLQQEKKIKAKSKK